MNNDNPFVVVLRPRPVFPFWHRTNISTIAFTPHQLHAVKHDKYRWRAIRNLIQENNNNSNEARDKQRAQQPKWDFTDKCLKMSLD